MKTISVEISNESDRQLRLVAARRAMNRTEFIGMAPKAKLAQLHRQVARSTANVSEADVVDRLMASPLRGEVKVPPQRISYDEHEGKWPRG